MISKGIKKINIGDKAFYKKKATKAIINDIAEFSEDFNPIHVDEKYAEKTKFKRCIAHGVFCLGLISKIIGMDLPGEGAVFVNEKLNYKLPVFIDDEITASVEITKIIEEKDLIEVAICCVNQKSEIVMDGTSLLKMV